MRPLNVVLFAIILLLVVEPSLGQQRSAPPQIRSSVNIAFPDWGLPREDVADLRITDRYRSEHNGLTHIYVQQRYQNIPIHNAISGLHYDAGGKLLHQTHRFHDRLAERANTLMPRLSPEAAVKSAATALGYRGDWSIQTLEKNREGVSAYRAPGLSDSPVPVSLVFFPTRDGALRLAYDLSIDMASNRNYWSLRIDAVTGELLDKNNWTVSCSFPRATGRTGRHRSFRAGTFPAVSEDLEGAARYRVFPFPAENPLRGDHQLVEDPSDSIASPYGWHDVDGRPGAEFTITRGNNTHAFLDEESDDESNQDEPNGGADLVFDFPFDADWEPQQYQDAAVTQLFYATNYMHDLAYHYGFDEPAGNFQSYNYGRGGRQGDAVMSNAQDGGGINNANFTAPPDGRQGRMQMFLWGRSNNELLEVESPETIAGSYSVSTATFGPPVNNQAIIGEVVQARDNSASPNQLCKPAVNAEALSGKIALIDRGGCTFEEKVRLAEAAGAIAVIICNPDEQLITMGGLEDIPDPGIPAVMLRASDCELIKSYLQRGVRVRLQRRALSGPRFLDGDLDNGIIAHEYAHGISIRLAGGPSQSNCLANDEQMGEGWSDFFTLITTAEPGDQGALPRGIGGYVVEGEGRGEGIRRHPYSTDPSVNSQHYDDIIATRSPHRLGEIWTSMLWDLYWEFVEVYGWDEDLIHGSGGNNIALQLIMDGIKLQPCQPGFVDARDAILAADRINFGGEHQCLIWEVFANRGLGYEARQGSPLNRNDGLPSFRKLPECVRQLKVAKTGDPLINAGDTITYTLTATNHRRSAAEEVTLRDELPAGVQFLPASVRPALDYEITGDALIFDLGTLAPGAQQTITYQVLSDPSSPSSRQFIDEAESENFIWDSRALEGDSLWRIDNAKAFSGESAWFAPTSIGETDQLLELQDPVLIRGEQPVLRFYNRYDIEAVNDGGIIQISNDNGASWQTIDSSLIFLNGYRGRLSFLSFLEPDIAGFWGEVEDFVPSYVDLSAFREQEILIRFRLSTIAEFPGDLETGEGWRIDDIEIMDLVNYQAEACVFSDGGDMDCAFLPSRGTLVESREDSSSSGVANVGRDQFWVYPNPASELVNLQLPGVEGPLFLEVMTSEGKSIFTEELETGGSATTYQMALDKQSPGFYVVRLRSGEQSWVRKLVLQ